MELKQLVEKASEGYSDDLIIEAFNGADVGDGLAYFIAEELKETYDEDATDDDQVQDAVLVLSNVMLQVAGVIKALARRR